MKLIVKSKVSKMQKEVSIKRIEILYKRVDIFYTDINRRLVISYILMKSNESD